MYISLPTVEQYRNRARCSVSGGDRADEITPPTNYIGNMNEQLKRCERLSCQILNMFTLGKSRRLSDRLELDFFLLLFFHFDRLC